jgi:exopolyphosphatase/guanosine-5'-triphosphate,3'-diphosphate pyrophosphatase
VRCACIDVGSNTTRLLVAEVADGLAECVVHEKAFIALGSDLRATGAIAPDSIARVTETVAAYRRVAAQAGAQAVRAVATAVLRDAADAEALCACVRARAGVGIEILTGAEEAVLAFAGAIAADRGGGRVAVIDVGGGSSEIAVGTREHGVEWLVSLAIGSGQLADRHLHDDPPTRAQLSALADEAEAAFAAGPPVPHVDRALAVGGSATSLCRLAGEELSPDALERAVERLTAAPAIEVAERLGLEAERVRLLRAGILVLRAAARRVECVPAIGRGGLREGVCIALAAASRDH